MITTQGEHIKQKSDCGIMEAKSKSTGEQKAQ